MFRAIGATTLAITLLAAVDRVPNFNVEPGCRKVAAMASPIGSMEICMRKEEEAREQLVREWAQFTPTEKADCIELNTKAGEPSYAALLACLEVRRDARNLRESNEREAARAATPKR